MLWVKGLTPTAVIDALAQYAPYVADEPTAKTVKQRLMYVGGCICAVLILGYVPLIGIRRGDGADPLGGLRLMMGSSRYSMMDLGLAPIFAAQLVAALLTVFGILPVRDGEPAAEVAAVVERLLSLLFTGCEAAVSIAMGVYGRDLPVGWQLVVFVQLMLVGMLLVLLGDVLRHYGFGVGTALFAAAGIAARVFVGAFSLRWVRVGTRISFEGAIPALVHLAAVRGPWQGLRHVYFRLHHPNLASLLATAATGGLMCYVYYIFVPVGLEHAQTGEKGSLVVPLVGRAGSYMIVQQVGVSAFLRASEFVSRRLPASRIARVLGVWELTPSGSVAVAGLASVVQPVAFVTGFGRCVANLFIHVALAAACGYLSAWVSGESARDRAQALTARGLRLIGHREVMADAERALLAVIVPAATVGAVIAALLAYAADAMGALASGHDLILLTGCLTTIVDDLAAKLRRENRHWPLFRAL